MERGVAYGVGVGPGDPGLMTLKAVRTVAACAVVAVPGPCATKSVAYKIAVAAVPELKNRELVALPSPMVGNRELVRVAQAQNAKTIEGYLNKGIDVACLTLGDPSIYSTFGYIQRVLQEDGYSVELVAGVPSFCAAAARLGVVLAEWDEPLHVVPATHGLGKDDLSQKGTHVLMKAGKSLCEAKDLLRQDGMEVCAVQRCGMRDECVYYDVDAIPDDAGYLTTIIAKTPVKNAVTQ